MSGYLVHVTIPGLSPDTRKMMEIWAAWFPKATDALKEVERLSGQPAEPLCHLSDDLLRGLGLTNEGQAVRVLAKF